MDNIEMFTNVICQKRRKDIFILLQDEGMSLNPWKEGR